MSKKTVGIWIRVSTEDQAKGESPEHHEKRARLYAEAKGWHVKEIYHLEAVSGKSVIEHPEARRMLSDIKEGIITAIIFSKLARLARNTRELLDFADIFREHNADLISLQESIDTSSPAGRLFYTMIAAMAQWEREEISERVAASVPIRAKLGKPIGGQAPFGYQWVDKQLRVNDTEAPVRKLIYEVFLKTKRKKTTARELNDMGYRTRNGSLFSDTTIDRLIRDTTAKGERIANYSKSLGEGKKWVIKPKSEWVVIPCPQIVPEDVWSECNRILDDQLKKRKQLGPKAVHLLSGYIYCTCGSKMYVFHENNVYRCKLCKNRVSAVDIDEIYHAQLKEFLFTDEDVTTFLNKSDSLIQEKETLLKTVLEKSANLQKRMNELVNMRINKEFSSERFSEHYKPLEEQWNQMQNEIPELHAEVDFLKIQLASSDIVMRDAKDLYTKWPTLPFEEKRGIVETITERITVGKEDINFKLAYHPTTRPQNGGKKQHVFRGS